MKWWLQTGLDQRLLANGCALLLLGGLACAPARAADPFTVTAVVQRAGSAWQVVVTAEAPPAHVLYTSAFGVAVDGRPATGRVSPAPIIETDALGERASVLTGHVEAVYALTTTAAGTWDVAVSYRGCSATVCYPPQTRHFRLSAGGLPTGALLAPAAEALPAAAGGWLAEARIVRQASGYMGARAFLDFLRPDAAAAQAGGLAEFVRDPLSHLRRHGVLWTLLLVLFGGLLLNLTPCVLPMIPINLAIIGAGARAGSRRRGAWLGAAYGAGMALAYGSLGLVVLLTGGVFGALESSPVFNLAIAVVFLVLGLAMFDVLPIDLSRFQNAGARQGGFLAAAVAGGISALLAGACVAPVVAAVLLLAGSLLRDGFVLAPLLPFLLGAGMALPWPLAGAGLAVLPRPGAWMVWVKHGFGVLIAVMALYYGWLAYHGFAAVPSAAPVAGRLVAGDAAGWRVKVAEAKAAGKPLLLDFYASWCKNCHVMDRTTLRDPAVRTALAGFVVVHVETEHPGDEPALGMVQALKVDGLPHFTIVQPTP